jgi:hypothetical protein
MDLRPLEDMGGMVDFQDLDSDLDSSGRSVFFLFPKLKIKKIDDIKKMFPFRNNSVTPPHSESAPKFQTDQSVTCYIQTGN